MLVGIIWWVGFVRVKTTWQLDLLTVTVLFPYSLIESIRYSLASGAGSAGLVIVLVLAALAIQRELLFLAFTVASIAIFSLGRIISAASLDSLLAFDLYLMCPFLLVGVRIYVGLMRQKTAELCQLEFSSEREIGQLQERIASLEQLRKESVARYYHAQKTESLGLLASGVANELNNLLLAITAFAESISRQSFQPEIADDADEIRKVALEASRICDQMLTYAGDNRDELEQVDVNGLLREVQPLLASAVTSQVRFSLDLAPSNAHFYGNFGQIRQVLINLATNAIESFADGKGKIQLTADCVDYDPDEVIGHVFGTPQLEGDYVSLTIGDDGCGMNVETILQAFDPYFTTKPKRSGLGLSTSLGIVRSHAGAIVCNSTPGCGTTMQVLLPLSRNKSKRSGNPSQTTSRGTLLVVDDEDIVLAAVTRMLTSADWSVIPVDNGMAALEVLRNRQCDVDAVLLDYSMPVMNGHDVLRRLRSEGCSVPIVLCSGLAMDNRYSESLQPNAYLHKPYRLRTLQSALASVLNN